MRKFLNIFCTISAVIGILLIYGSVGASDYHVLVLGESAPASANVPLLIGIELMMPSLITLVYRKVGEYVDGYVDC